METRASAKELKAIISKEGIVGELVRGGGGGGGGRGATPPPRPPPGEFLFFGVFFLVIK